LELTIARKLDALEQRIARIASLFEDPALKLEEAQFWIQVERKIIQVACASIP
jgi:hypothetical protein